MDEHYEHCGHRQHCHLMHLKPEEIDPDVDYGPEELCIISSTCNEERDIPVEAQEKAQCSKPDTRDEQPDELEEGEIVEGLQSLDRRTAVEDELGHDSRDSHLPKSTSSRRHEWLPRKAPQGRILKTRRPNVYRRLDTSPKNSGTRSDAMRNGSKTHTPSYLQTDPYARHAHNERMLSSLNYD